MCDFCDPSAEVAFSNSQIHPPDPRKQQIGADKVIMPVFLFFLAHVPANPSMKTTRTKRATTVKIDSRWQTKTTKSARSDHPILGKQANQHITAWLVRTLKPVRGDMIMSFQARTSRSPRQTRRWHLAGNQAHRWN